MAVSCRVVLGMEGDCPGVYGPPAYPTPRRFVGENQDTKQCCCPGVSGIATDVMLFHQYGGLLLHLYRLYADPLLHVSLRGRVMTNLSRFTIHASAVARLTILKVQTLCSAKPDRVGGSPFRYPIMACLTVHRLCFRLHHRLMFSSHWMMRFRCLHCRFLLFQFRQVLL